MLTVLIVMSMFYSGHTVVNYGRDFITAFPEHIAYYYPLNLTNILKITALYDKTAFNVTFNDTIIVQETLYKGYTRTVYLPDEVEEYQLQQPSSKSVRVTSDNDITVFFISKRGESLQTNVVQPASNLGKAYQVLFPNFTEIIANNRSDQSNPRAASIYNAFRLLIINAEEKYNTINITQSNSRSSATSFTLKPFEFIQMMSNDSYVTVTATANISVWMTHPCLETYVCRCAMVLHQLRPSFLLGESFLVPSSWITNSSRVFSTSDQLVSLTFRFFYFKSSQTLSPGSNPLAFYRHLMDEFSNITSSQPVSLSILDIGIWIDLIPTSMFSACYLVHSTNYVLLIVQSNQTSSTVIENFSNHLNWNTINGTDYSWATVDLNPWSSYVIWHPYSKMAVYVYENETTTFNYGGPAIVVTEDPDTGGCLVSPSTVKLSNKSRNWQESKQFCSDNEGELASPNSAQAQDFMKLELAEVGASGQAWIGLRRSLLTTDWYWLNGSDLSFTNWDRGQPLSADKGLCASVILKPKGSYSWSSMRCCSAMKPVCYIPAKYLHLQNPYS